MLRGPLFVIDFEGTPASGVIEFGVVRWEGGRVEEVFTDLCRPSGPVCWRDARVHGLDGRDLQQCRPFDDYFGEFVKRRRQGLLVAHHCSVEARLLRHHWPLVPEVPDPLLPGAGCHTWGPFVDTLKVIRAAHPSLAALNLKAAVEALGLRDELERLGEKMVPAGRCDWHCAPYDALAASLLLKATLEVFPDWSETELLHLSGTGPADPELF